MQEGGAMGVEEHRKADELEKGDCARRQVHCFVVWFLFWFI